MDSCEFSRSGCLECTAAAGAALTITSVAVPFSAPATAVDGGNKRIRVGVKIVLVEKVFGMLAKK
jgi:hypothetical protein